MEKDLQYFFDKLHKASKIPKQYWEKYYTKREIRKEKIKSIFKL